MTPVLHLEGVSAAYGDRRILHDIRLEIRAGDCVALIGPNGAGKSTLLRVMSGLQPTVSGSVRLEGEDVARLPPSRRARRMSVVPQELTTPFPWTVRELAAMGRRAATGPWGGGSPADRQRVDDVMRELAVADLADRPYDQLSGGERQRTAVAMALAQDPVVLLLDEPTSHLDWGHRIAIARALRRRNREQGLTIVLTSHDLNLAAEFGDRLVLLQDGRIVADGPPADLMRDELLSRVYACPLRVTRDPVDGSWFVRGADTTR